MVEEKITTVAIYLKDKEVLERMCRKNESYKDKIHEILIKIKGGKRERE